LIGKRTVFFLVLAFYLFPGIFSYAQRERSDQQTTTSSIIHIELPAAGKDGFRVYEKYDVKLSDGNKTKEKYSQKYSFGLKPGEFYHIVAAAESFNVGLMPGLKNDQKWRRGLITDKTYNYDQSYVWFDSVSTKEDTIYFTISNESPVAGDETYYLQVVIAGESVMNLPSRDFCENLIHLTNHCKYDFFMLKEQFVKREYDEKGFIDDYDSFYYGDWIIVYQHVYQEYYSPLITTEDLNGAKKELDKYIDIVKQCIKSWNFTNEESEKFDEGLGKDFGVVSYSTRFTDYDNYTYSLTIAIAETPDKKSYNVLLRLFLE